MRPLAVPVIAGVLFFALGPALPALAAAPARCSHATFAVDGASLSATLCVPAEAGASVTVSESFTRGGSSFDASLPFEAVPGATVSRTVQDVLLAAIGSPKTLHLTIRYENGVASIEHALLLPGAIPLK